VLNCIRSLLRVLRSRRHFEQGMSEELQFHIEQYTDDLVRSGVPPQEASRRARIEFGSLNSVQEECREAHGLHPFDEIPARSKSSSPKLHGNRNHCLLSIYRKPIFLS
jgi:putative ABC transport system permease protein